MPGLMYGYHPLFVYFTVTPSYNAVFGSSFPPKNIVYIYCLHSPGQLRRSSYQESNTDDVYPSIRTSSTIICLIPFTYQLNCL